MDGEAADWLAEQEAETARRWQPFVDAFLECVPEVRASLEQESDGERARRFTPADLWIQVVTDLLDNDDYPARVHADVWPRILAFLEVAEELAELLSTESQHEDATTAEGFVSSGILCDVTRNVAGLQELLPWMGPRTVAAARGEVECHGRSRAGTYERVDWSVAGNRFVPLAGLQAEQLHPID